MDESEVVATEEWQQMVLAVLLVQIGCGFLEVTLFFEEHSPQAIEGDIDEGRERVHTRSG